MKHLRTLSQSLFFFLLTISYSQTPEQQKHMENMEKQAAEAQQKAMEMMKDNPQFQEALKMMEAAEQQMEQEQNEKQSEIARSQKGSANDHLKEFYWRNKVASNTRGSFDSWRWGEVEIAYFDGKGKRGPYGKVPYEAYTIVGKISGSGNVVMDLPSEAETNRTISQGLFPEMHEMLNDEVNYTNPNAPFLWAGYRLDVLKDGETIGHLTIGNSERTTHNLASPSDLKYGDEGYLLYWAYAAEPCMATFDKQNKNAKVNEGEVEKVISQHATGHMNFKPGWNLVKIEVKGNHAIGNRTRWKSKSYTIVESTPDDARYYFRYE